MRKVFLCSLLVLFLFQVGVDNAQAAGRRVRGAAVAGCPSIVSIGPLIWKGCAASGHLGPDPRSKGVALIKRHGGGLNPSSSAIPILNSIGTKIGCMSTYALNDSKRGPYSWRAYSNYGCGVGTTMSSIRSLSRGKPIYLKMNSRQCILIPRAYSNINSSQRC